MHTRTETFPRSLTVVAALLVVGLFCGCEDKNVKHQHNPETITVLNYSEYISPEMITDFQMKTGYRMILETYEAQEEMLARLKKADTNQYDVIIASDVVIQQMIKLGYIAPLDTEKIPNRVNIADQFRNPSYDPTNSYTVPYLWGTTGILYRDTTLDASKLSYKTLFDSTQAKGKFTLLDEARSMLSMALQAEGFDANSVSPTEIAQAAKLLYQTKKNKGFGGFTGSVEGKERVMSGKSFAAIVFSGEAVDAILEDPSLQYAIPVEGSFMWMDAMTLGAKSTNKEGAFAFMNYILDAKIGMQLAKFNSYATPNKAALLLIDDEFKSNHVINPSKEEMGRMVFLRDPGDAACLFDEAWVNIKK